jgi:hypothetical protein
MLHLGMVISATLEHMVALKMKDYLAVRVQQLVDRGVPRDKAEQVIATIQAIILQEVVEVVKNGLVTDAMKDQISAKANLVFHQMLETLSDPAN